MAHRWVRPAVLIFGRHDGGVRQLGSFEFPDCDVWAAKYAVRRGRDRLPAQRPLSPAREG